MITSETDTLRFGIADGLLKLEVEKAGFYYHRILEGRIVVSITACALRRLGNLQTFVSPTDYNGYTK